MNNSPVEQQERCAWELVGNRCMYPGVMARGFSSAELAGDYMFVVGERFFYCKFHYGCGDPVQGLQIVWESMNEKNVAAYFSPLKNNRGQ